MTFDLLDGPQKQVIGRVVPARRLVVSLPRTRRTKVLEPVAARHDQNFRTCRQMGRTSNRTPSLTFDQWLGMRRSSLTFNRLTDKSRRTALDGGQETNVTCVTFGHCRHIGLPRVGQFARVGRQVGDGQCQHDARRRADP